MAVDPIGGSPELEPELPIRPQEPPVGMPSVAGAPRQAPTGFGGPTPVPAPMRGTSPHGVRTPNQFAGLGPTQPGWSEAQSETLRLSLLRQDQTLSGPRMNQMMNSVMSNSDPSIIELAEKKFERQVAMSTQEMFEERSFQRMIGYVDDDEALSLATGDLWLDNWGSVFSAGQVFTNAESQKTWFTEGWLGNPDRFNTLDNQVTVAAQAAFRDKYGVVGTDRAGAWGAYQAEDIVGAARGAVRALSGKGGTWAVDGNNLAIRFSDGDNEWDTLVRLKPGTTIETTADAIQAYALAVADVVHAVDPTSDETPGPQALLGAMWEGLDNVVQAIEKFGTNGTIPSLNQQIAAVDASMMTGRRNPTVDGVDMDEESLVDNVQAAHVEKATRDAIITTAARNAALDEGAPMSSIVQAGIFAYDAIPDKTIETINAEQINDLVEAAQAKEAETSYLAQYLQEDVFDPVLGALQTWEAALQFVGVSLLHVTTVDEIIDLGRRVAEEGVGVLLDPANLQLAPLLDWGQLADDFADVREVGLPAFTAAYTESMMDRTISDEFDLDPESNAAFWANMAGSLAVDPITWLTLGGNASWKALGKSLTTVAGAKEYVFRPQVVSAARQLVEKNNTNILTIFISDGLSSSGISRLSRILATNYTDDAAKIAAMGDVQNILFNELPAMGGRWLPSGPGRAITRKTTLGLGQFFARLGGKGWTNDSFMRLAQDVLARAPRQRFAAIGEREFLSDASTRLTIMYGDDAVKYAEKLDEAVGVYDAVRVGDDAIGVIEGQIQATRDQLSALAGGVTADVKFVPNLRKNVSAMDDSIRALDDAIESRVAVGDDAAAAGLRDVRDRAIASRDESQRFLDELTPVYQDVTSSIRDKQKLLDRYLAQQSMLGTGQRDRGMLERWTHGLYDEWADNINRQFVEKGWATPDDLPIPVVPGEAHPWFPDLPRRDWSKITGKTPTQTYRSPQAGNLEAFGATADDLRAIGMGAVSGSTPLPASPYEMLAFTHTRPAVWDALHFSAMGQGFKTMMDGLQSIWSASVLLNPRTSLRSSLDEVIRFYEDNGLSTDAIKAAYRSAPGTANVGGPVGSEARAYARDQLDSFLPSSVGNWEMIDPSKRGMWVHAERWVNGTLMQDPQFKAFARAVAASNGSDDVARQLWEQWWAETGSKLSRRHTFAAGSSRAGEPIHAGNSFDIIKNSLDTWLIGVTDDEARAGLRQAMIEAASTNEIVPGGAAMWRRVGSVPGQVEAGSVRPLEAGFNLMYGSPQARRGAVFYDHYYEFAMKTYKDANAGKVIDAEWLVKKGHAQSLYEANNMIASGSRNETVRQIVAETGYALEADLKNAAMRWASTQADNMMYTFGAESILGKKMARVYPFGRAQVDYMQWWLKKLTQPTQFGLPGARTATVATTGGVNLRLIDRMAHLVGTGTPQEPGSYERPSALSPAGVVENFSFLPSTLDNQFVMDIPSFGPIPGWMVNLPLEGTIPGWEGIREAMLQTNPSLMTFTEPYEDWGDALLGLWDTIIPKSGLSVWNLGKAAGNAVLLAAAYASLGLTAEDPLTPEIERRINATVSSLIWEKDTPYWRDQYAIMASGWLTDSGADTLPDLNNQEWIGLQDEATLKSLHENLNDTLGKIAGAAVQGGSDFQYTDALMPAIDYVDAWFDAGWVSAAKRDSLVIGHETILAGGASPKDRLIYADDVLDALFTLIPKEARTEFIAENPGAAINFVSWYEVVPSLVPDYAQAGVSGNRIIAQGDEARELRIRGREDGWLVAKDPNKWLFEAQMSVHRAYRDRITDIYEEVINDFVTPGVREAIGLDPNMPITFARDTLAFAATRGPVPAGWWEEHGEWLTGVKGFAPPAEAVAAWTAGSSYSMTLGEFRGMFKDAKDRYAYTYTDDTLNEVALRRLGDNDTPPGRLARSLANLDGYENVDFDETKPLSYYGADLVKDITDAVSKAESQWGWSDPREWETDEFSIETEPGVFKTYNLDEFRERFYVAVALSALSPSDDMTFTEADYESSQWARWLGEIDFTPPAPPPLDEVEAEHTTTPDRVTVVDGDTVKIMGDDGPVFLRLLGINAPERDEPGYAESKLGLMDVIDESSQVSFAIWQPERYGRTQTFFTRDAVAGVQYRDRTFVWLYVDGKPLYDATVFTPTNIRGVGTGGEIPDYQAMKERSG